ncbi:MAG: outer membrane beta-barrel protein [Bacteroidetes bacterium]|nr:outer membrane beta-barrel protein [Bacteroidota bacterium]MCH8524726.1 porin family protein [Balneolales bacterium]
MHRLNHFLLAVLLLVTFNSLTQAQSQEGDISVGIGLAYGFDLEEPAIGLGGVYTINEQFRAAVDLHYYLIASENFGGVDIDYNVWELNMNAHYMFVNDETKTLYALGGINYFRIKVSASEGAFNISESDSEVGLNLGGGAEYNLGNFRLYGELKFSLGDASQMFLGAGVRFGI